MRGWRLRFRHRIGRAASLAAALLAVVMLVAGGASHELLHADEAEAPAAQAAAVRAAPAAIAHAADVKVAGKTGAGHTAPVHSCSGHCAAHTANQPPPVILVSAPVAMTARWRLDPGHAASLHPSSGPDRPPRA